MDRRDISKVLMGSAAGAALLSERAQAQTCVAPCYPRTDAERAARVTPTDCDYPPYSDSRRYGAVCDGGTDDSAALQRQIDSCIAAGAEMVLGQGGTTGTGYILLTPLVITGQIKITGGGYGRTAVITIGCNAFDISAGVTQVEFQGFRINSAVRHTDVPNTFKGINIQGTTGSACVYHTYRDLFIDGFETPIQANGVRDSVFDNIVTLFCKHGIIAAEQTVNNRVIHSKLSGDGAHSYGVQVGDGVAASEGWTIEDSLLFGFSTGVWGYGSSNSKVVGCFIDFFTQYGVLLQSGPAIAAANWDISSNYIAASGSSASSGVRCLSSIASSDHRGNRIALNDILAYPGSALSYGILVDGTHEVFNTLQSNHVKATVYSCYIKTGSGCVVNGNHWINTGFATDVMVTYEGNNGLLISPLLTRQTNGSNFIYHSVGAPPAGSYLRGDIAWVTAPVAGGTPGYMCVAAPSTWKAMANLAV